MTGVAVLLAGCSPLAALNSLYVKEEYSAREAAYGPDPRQGLTVYGPKAGDGGASLRPVVLFFYGGSWKSGARRDYRFVAEALVARGYMVVIPDYRVYPDVVFPAFVEDAAAAAVWTMAHAEKHGGDSRKIFVAGHSAGAHIAMLLALDPSYLEAAGRSSADLRGVIGLAGPYSFDPLATRSVKPVFADLADINRARPVTYASPDSPPALLLHGGDDRVVWPQNSLDLAEALHGATVTARIYPGVSHAGVVLGFYWPFSSGAPVADDMDRFMRAVLAGTENKAGGPYEGRRQGWKREME